MKTRFRNIQSKIQFEVISISLSDFPKSDFSDSSGCERTPLKRGTNTRSRSANVILKRDDQEKIFTLVAHPYKEDDVEEDSFKKKNSRTTYSKRTTRKSRSGMGLILILILTVLGQRGFRRVI